MGNFSRSVDKLTLDDLLPFAVWRFAPESQGHDETMVKRVDRFPLKELNGCLVSTSVRLNNGQKVAGLIGNLSPSNPQFNELFSTLTVVLKDGRRFHLARYHDLDYEHYGPQALAGFLGIPASEVFPISYELPENLIVGVGSFSGHFTEEPVSRLSRAEVIALAVP